MKSFASHWLNRGEGKIRVCGRLAMLTLGPSLGGIPPYNGFGFLFLKPL